MGARHWTEAELAQLRTLRATHSDVACGAALGVSATTVRRWADKHGIPACADPAVLQGNGHPPWPPDRVALLRELRASGMPYQDIAHAMGISKSTVCGKAQRLGLPSLDVPLKRRPGVKVGRPAKMKPVAPKRVAAPAIRAQRAPTAPAPRERTFRPLLWSFGCPCCARHLIGPLLAEAPGWKGVRL